MRRFWLPISLCAGVCVVTLAAFSHTHPSAYARTPCALQIGDSLTVGAAPYLARFNVQSDGAIGRQWATGESIVRWRFHVGTLPQRVIIELGTNGPVTDAQFKGMLRFGNRRVVFVTPSGPRWWIAPNARLIASEARRYGFGVLRWDRLAADVGPDGIHLTRYDRFAYLTAHSIGCVT